MPLVRRQPTDSVDVARAQAAFAAEFPQSQPNARTATPTITLGSAADAATPTFWPAVNNSTNVINPTYQLNNGNYIQATSAFPDNQAVRMAPQPINPVGYGSSVIDFISDAPALSVRFQRAQNGSARVVVDGVEVLRNLPAVNSGTAAAAGTTTTITLASSASTTAGYYVGQWIHLTGGGGSGSFAQITAYTTGRVATVAPAFSAATTTATTYEITDQYAAFSNSTQSGYAQYYFKLDWSGERRYRRYRVETHGFNFLGVYTAAIDSVYPAPQPEGQVCVWAGDSYSAGTGADGGFVINALSRVCCDAMGWQLRNVSVGGTGFISTGAATSNTTYVGQRLIPPLNSWSVFTSGATAGTFTLTQGGTTTAAIAYNATIATIQSVVDTAFGAGAFLILGDSAKSFFLLGQGATGSVATAMTLNSSLTGAPASPINHWLGDLAPHVPKDGAGNPLPFNLVLACGHNDTGSSAAAIQSTVTTLIQNLVALYPTMTLYVVGVMWLPGSGAGGSTAGATATDNAIQAATQAAAPLVNGKVPFIETLSWFTGTGNRGALAGNGNCDICCWTDGVHPTVYGHQVYGQRIAQAIQQLLAA